MKNEAELCTIIRNSMINGVKIPDPSGNFTQTSIRCFDGIGMLPAKDFGYEENMNVFVCWEAKYLKEPKAFSLKRVEDHQAFYLSAFSKAMCTQSLLILGVDFGRADKRVFVFKWTDTMAKLFKEGFSFHKDILYKLPFNEVHKDTFEFKKYIDDKVLIDIYGDKITGGK